MSNKNSLLPTQRRKTRLSTLRLLFGVDGLVRILGAVSVSGVAITSEIAPFSDFSVVVQIVAGVVVVLSGLGAAGLAVGVIQLEKGLVLLIGADVLVVLAGIAVLIAGFCSLPIAGVTAVTGLIVFTVLMAVVQSVLAALPAE